MNTCPSSSSRQRGISLVELLIAITLGLFILAGLSTLFISNNRTRAETERTSRQIENGRYAIQLIQDDLRLAGFYGEYIPPTKLPDMIAKPDPCDVVVANMGCTTAGCSAAPAFLLHVQGYDNGTGAPNCLADRKAGTDILVVRRASSCVAGSADCDAVAGGAPYFQASLCTPPVPGGIVASGEELSNVTNPCPVCNKYFLIDSAVGNLTLHEKDCNTVASVRRYKTHIYYIANNDNLGDGIPTLKRAELGAGVVDIVPLAEGVEDLQFEYGLDTNGDGMADAYAANPDNYPTGNMSLTMCTTLGIACNWWNAVSVKINLLARNTEASPGYTDSKSYVLGLKADGTDNVLGPYSDEYRRHVYTAAVRLANPSGRRQ